MGPLYYFQNNKFILSRETNSSDLKVEHNSWKVLTVKERRQTAENCFRLHKLNIRFWTWLGQTRNWTSWIWTGNTLMHWRTFFHVVLASTKKYHLRHIYLVTYYQAVGAQLLAIAIEILFSNWQRFYNNSSENLTVDILRSGYIFIFAW